MTQSVDIVTNRSGRGLLRQTKDATECGGELGIAVGVQDRVDCGVCMAQDDGDDDCIEVGATGEQRDGVHDVQWQPTQGEHG